MSALNFTTQPAALQADPESVWTDDDPWCEPPGPRSLIETVEDEARAYDAWGDDAGRLLAAMCRSVANDLRYTGARTAREHWARMEVFEAWDREG